MKLHRDDVPRDEHKQLRLIVVAIAVLSLPWIGVGCAGLSSRTEAQEATSPLPWVRAVYPVLGDEEVRVDRRESSVTLVRGGQIYGSTSPRDIPGQVVGMVAALALSAEGPTLLRVGQIGFGTGASVSVALNAGSRVVDVFERDGHVVAAAEAITATTGLTYQDGERRPIHPALRLVPIEQAQQERFLRYDILVSPPATSALGGPQRLLTVERLENLVALLSSGGVLVHHLPASDMEPESFQRLLRTFANVFPYMLVVAAAPQSSDLFMIGSSSPLVLRPDHLYAIDAMPSVSELLTNAGLTHPFDLPSRVIFSSRDEVMNFVQGARPCTARAPLSADGIGLRPAVPAPDAPEAEQTQWREAMEAHRQRFRRMELLREQMYGLDWPHGQVCPDGPGSEGCLFAQLATDTTGSEVLAELSLSLMAGGRFVEAQLTLETASALGRPQVLDRAQQVLTLLLDDPPDLDERMPETLPEIRTALVEDRCGDVAAGIEGLVNADDGTAPERRLIVAYALVRCRGEEPEAMEQVATLVEPLVSDDTFSQRYPEVFYLHARSAMVRGQYETATWTMVGYVSRVEPPPGDTEEPPPSASEANDS